MARRLTVSGKRRDRPSRGGLLGTALVVLAIAVAALCGLWLQDGSASPWTPATRRAARPRPPTGSTSTPPSSASTRPARELILRIQVTRVGRSGRPTGLSPRENLTPQTSPAVRGDLTFPPHGRIATVDVRVSLTGGHLTDYPFDSSGRSP